MPSLSPSHAPNAASLLLSLLLCACPGPAKDSDPGEPRETAGETGSPEHTEPAIESLGVRLHEDIGSIVYLSWQQLDPATTWVEYSFDDAVWYQTPVKDTEAGSEEVLLLGIPYGTDLLYRVVNDFGSGALTSEESSTSTGALPEALVLPTLLVSDPAAFDPDTLWLLASVNIDIFEPWWSVILDRQGRIVWALETDRLWSTMMPRPSHDGTTLIIDHNSYWQQFDEGENSMLRRIKIDGTVLAEQAVPGMHHAWTDMPDGSVVYGAGQPVEKLLMVAPDGAMQEIWDCADFLSSAGLEDQDCRSNFVDWRADTDTFLFSSVSLETLLVIDHASGETLRWFGDAGGPWVFDPPESQFWWQHGAHYLADGTILVSTKNEDGGNETLVRQFEEDTESQTLRQVWSFGEGEGVYTKAGGGASRLDNGNTLHHYGQTSRMREATPAGEVVWDLEWGSDDSQLGHVWPLDDLYAFVP